MSDLHENSEILKNSPVPVTGKNQLETLIQANYQDLVKFVGRENGTILFQFLLSLNNPHTRRAYFFDLIHFFKFLKVNKRGRDYKLTSRTDLDHFKEQMLRYGPDGNSMLSPSTVKRKLTAVSKFFTFLVRQNIVQTNPAQFVERPSVPLEVKSEPFTREELKTMLSLIDPSSESGALHMALLVLMSSTGLRVGEVTKLKVADYKRQGDEATIFAKAGKSHRTMKKELSKRCREAIDHYLLMKNTDSLSSTDPLFTGTRGKKTESITSQGIYKIFTTLSKKAGITKKITPHSARSYFITEGLEHVSIGEMAREVAHTSIIMTNEYDKRRKNNSKKLSENLI